MKFRSDTSQLRGLSRALRKSSPATVRAVQRALRAEGQKIADEAANKAGWSTRIPGTLKVRVRGLIGIVIEAGGSGAPHAKPFEHEGKNGMFRHPLNWPSQGSGSHGTARHWVEQDARPFLHPAVIERLLSVREALTMASVTAIKDTLGKEI